MAKHYSIGLIPATLFYKLWSCGEMVGEWNLLRWVEYVCFMFKHTFQLHNKKLSFCSLCLMCRMQRFFERTFWLICKVMRTIHAAMPSLQTYNKDLSISLKRIRLMYGCRHIWLLLEIVRQVDSCNTDGASTIGV